jgi:hypothetical protein
VVLDPRDSMACVPGRANGAHCGLSRSQRRGTRGKTRPEEFNRLVMAFLTAE